MLFEPAAHFIGQRADVGPADFVQIGSKLIGLRRQEPHVLWVRVGAADERQFDDVMGRDHPRVGRMELAGQHFAFQKRANLVNPFGNNEARPFGSLGQKITHRPADRAGHADGLALLVKQGKLAVNCADLLGIARADALHGFVQRHVEQHVGGRVKQIDESFDGRGMQG